MTKSRGKGRARAGSDVKHDRSGLKGTKIRTKKGGGGGHFTWGRPGDETFIPAVTPGDLNYDSQEDADGFNYSLDFQPNARRTHNFSYLNYTGENITTPKYTLQIFKEAVVKAIREYFVEGESGEFLRTIEDLDCSMFHYELVKKLISLSMEKSDLERELVSKILIELQDNQLLPVSQLAKGFERLFETVDDLKLDIPGAKKMLSQFLARSVADEVMPPAFLNDQYVINLAGNIIEHAKVLLSIKHNLGRLENIWGVNMTSSVEDLKNEIKMILLEYISSSDCTEVATLLKSLNVPFFHHEVIKRGVVISLERKEREQAMISVLFKELVHNEIISKHQLLLGYQRLYQELDDIKLDNPDAHTIIGIFASQSIKDGCMTEDQLLHLKGKAAVAAQQERKISKEDLSSGYDGRQRSDSVPH